MNNFSICIPTFNRAKLLDFCLGHLATFGDKTFEIIVGDNASDDDTQEVIDSRRGQFPYFVYLRHSENIGFARNMDSLIRKATREFVYILNDDDLLFESTLNVSAGILNANKNIAAVVGKYISLRKLDPTLTVDYSDAIASLIPQGAHATLMDNTNVCDGHPIIRRKLFERHCAYLDRTGTLIPLYFTMLKHGDLCVINKPFFQHLTNGNSLTSRMAEAWFLDMANADIELAVSGCLESLPADAMIGARQKLLQLMYLQAARMSINHKRPYLLWMFLRRLNALQIQGDEMLLKCEYHFTHDFIVDRIECIIRDGELKKVHYVKSDIVDVVVFDISKTLPEVLFIPFDLISDIDDVRYLICNRYTDPSVPESVKNKIALEDLFLQVRLTEYDAVLNSIESRIVVNYATPGVIDKLITASHAFNILCSPYSEI